MLHRISSHLFGRRAECFTAVVDDMAMERALHEKRNVADKLRTLRRRRAPHPTEAARPRTTDFPVIQRDFLWRNTNAPNIMSTASRLPAIAGKAML